MAESTSESKREGEGVRGGEGGEGIREDSLRKDSRSGLVGDHKSATGTEEDDEDEFEPNLKYTRLTGKLAAVYRNGDSTSCFQAAGDKLILGTHNGNIHVLSILSLQTVRFYRAHSASVTAISVSPLSRFFPTATADSSANPNTTDQDGPAKRLFSNSFNTNSPKSPRQRTVPAILANSIYIATASLDGNVCVSSLVDSKDVTLRNYGRPVNAVALSPDFKNDRTYVSGGLAGNLILTVGGPTGVSSKANTNIAAAAASGWLGSIGLGASAGRDTILHSGEGSINTIKWSLSGKYVVWVNEQGIKIMNAHLNGDSINSDSAWKRIAHIDHPTRRSWQDMAGLWKARVEWVDEQCLEASLHNTRQINGSETNVIDITKARQGLTEKLIVGWGDTVWTVNVNSGLGTESSKGSGAKADISHMFRFDDCIISGLALYTPSVLLVLAYRTRNDNDEPIPTTNEEIPRRGIQRRQNGLPPDMRLIDLNSSDTDKDTIEVEGLSVSRFESLSASDYHLSTIFFPSIQSAEPITRSTFGALGEGLWDVGKNATRLIGSNVSVLSGSSSGDKTGLPADHNSAGKSPAVEAASVEASPALSKVGLKIFIQSPFDCILAFKRDFSDRLTWLLDHEDYQEAWELIEKHPDIVSSNTQHDSRPSTPSKTDQSLVDFFADDTLSLSMSNASGAHNSATEKEKRRIGDLWIQQLVAKDQWQSAGAIAGKVLSASSQWEHWILVFGEADKFDDITPYIPKRRLKPPLPSLVYEVVLGHYIGHDRVRLKDLLDEWEPDLFNTPNVISALQSKLESGEFGDDVVKSGKSSRDWHILLDSLAKLYLADARPADALECYIRTRNADAAFELIRQHQVLTTVVKSIYDFVLLRVTESQLANSPFRDLDAFTSEPIYLLASGAMQGQLTPSTVISQLQSKSPGGRPLLFFFFRALWRGEIQPTEASTTESSHSYSHTPLIRRSRFNQAIAVEEVGRSLLEPYGDLAIDLFAEYSRPLLMDLLKSTQVPYTIEHASAVCEARHYIPELVHLLSAVGQMRRALYLIIDQIGDVSQAIAFAKDTDDESLWNDLLDYSMDKPRFIRGLLEEVGTAIDPVTLVKRIPETLDIEGLKDSLGKLIRGSEIQWSISEGAARIVHAEVAVGMNVLKKGRLRGVVFDGGDRSKFQAASDSMTKAKKMEPGRCAKCSSSYIGNASDTREHLLGFPCGHIFHLACLLDSITADTNKEQIGNLQNQLKGAEEKHGVARGKVGAKIAHAQMIASLLGPRPCIICGENK